LGFSRILIREGKLKEEELMGFSGKLKEEELV